MQNNTAKTNPLLAQLNWNELIKPFFFALLCFLASIYTVQAQSGSQDTVSQSTDFQLKVNLPKKGQPPASVSSKSLTQIDLKHLADHDIVLLLDKSGSMNTPDCSGSSNDLLGALAPSLPFGNVLSSSRWHWCFKQVQQMAEQTQHAIPDGFTVILFDFGYRVFTHVTVQGLAKIYGDNHPIGGTNLEAPLDAVFSDYNQRRNKTQGNIKPLLIGIITDGCPNSPQAVQQVIVAGTHMMRYPTEITIVFFLVGRHDRQGEKFVSQLSDKLLAMGATYNIVKSVPFEEMQDLPSSCFG